MKSIRIEADQFKFGETKGKWFPFSSNPDFKGFELQLNFLTPREMDKLQNRCTKIRRGREIFDNERYFELETELVFIGFRGLKIKMLKKLMPNLKTINPSQGQQINDDVEIEFDPEIAFLLRQNSYGIRIFINERKSEEEEFSEEAKEAEAKN